ncbi:MAG TPA: manganese efflux pump MntP family protein [Anaerolineales bacterium]|nr:manganese efflux pump MntP family protein [Anaerolineales bacterium]
MPFIEILLISLSMAMDAFAVCLAAGTLEEIQGPRPLFRLSFHFGLFQFIMPVIGWMLGTTIEPLIRNYSDLVAFGLLAFVGMRMIYSSLRDADENRLNDPSRGWTLVLLSVAVSVDALAIGLSLGVLGVFVWYPAILIGVVTGVLSLVGLRIGRVVGRKFGKPVEIIGGLVLIGIGLRILFLHFSG